MKVIAEFIKPTRAFYDVVQDGIIITNLKGLICYANESAKKILHLGRTPEGNQFIHDIFINASDLTEVLMKLAVKQNHVRIQECRTGHGATTQLQVCFSLLAIPEEDPIGMQITFNKPTTNRAKDADYFRQHSAMLHALNFRSREIVFISDLAQKTNVFCSQSLENILGWPVKDFMDGGWGFAMSISHPDDTEVLVKTFVDAIELRTKEKFIHDQEPIIYDYRKRHKNGRWLWLHSECFVLERAEDESIKYLITFMRDITAEKTGTIRYNDSGFDNMLESQFDKKSNGTPAEVKKFRLTSREKEILRLVKDGLSTKEISDILSIGISSVNTYRKNLMKKLNARNTAELVQKSFDADLG